MEWWDEDPELLGATLGMLAAWHDDGTGSGRGSVSSGRGSLTGSVAPRDKPVDHDHDGNDDGTDTSATSSSQSASSSASRGSARPPKTATPSDTPATATTATVAPSSAIATGRSVNVSRERRKRELQRLRDECAALQRQLLALRGRRAELLRPHYGDARQLVSAAPVWENMATRQVQARRKSERRNAQLKRALETHARVARDLVDALQRVQLGNPYRPLPLAPRWSEGTFRMAHESQRARLERICAHWPDAFARSPKFRTHGPLQFLEVQVQGDAPAAAVVVDLFSSQVLPFSPAQVEDVMWSMFNGERSGVEHLEDENDDTTYDQKLSGSDDFLTAQFTTTSSMGLGATRGAMSGNWVIKRFGARDPPSRLVVSHAFSVPRGFENELDTALVDDDSWARVVDAHALGHTHLPPPLTVVQHVRRTRIAFGVRAELTAAPPADRVERITRWFVRQMRDELAWAQETLESLVIDTAHIKRERATPNSS